MKVALLTSDRERCGIARYSRDLHAALTPLVDVELVPIHPWPPGGERLERLRAADIVHLQHEYSFWDTAFPPPPAYTEGLERFRKPGRLVITAHTVADAETVVAARGPGLKPWVKRLALRLRPGLRAAVEADPFRLAERVIVHSPAATVLGKRLGRPAAVQFWPMPVPKWSVPASDWEPLAKQFRLEGRRLVTIFGFVTPEKGYELAIAAMGVLRDTYPESILVIAGGARTPDDAAYLQQLEARVAQLEGAPQVCFTGFLSDADARAVLEHSEVVLLPYRKATGSYAAGAALSAGCPLVTSEAMAFAEPLPALRLPAGLEWWDRCEVFRENLDRLLRDPSLRADLASRSREYAALNTWARAAERHVALYRELVG